MAVVAIVGTLTAIAVPAIGRIRKASQIKEAEIQLEDETKRTPTCHQEDTKRAPRAH